MTTVSPHIKTIPSETSYFINLAPMAVHGGTGVGSNPALTGARVYQLVGGNSPPVTTGSTAYPSFSTATWCTTGPTSSILAQAGGAIFRDLGKTIVSSLRTFRKVQLVVSSISNGVTVGTPVASGNGNQPWTTSGSVLGEEYYSGYIELVGAYGSTGGTATGSFNVAPVARLG